MSCSGSGSSICSINENKSSLWITDADIIRCGNRKQEDVLIFYIFQTFDVRHARKLEVTICLGLCMTLSEPPHSTEHAAQNSQGEVAGVSQDDTWNRAAGVALGSNLLSTRQRVQSSAKGNQLLYHLPADVSAPLLFQFIRSQVFIWRKCFRKSFAQNVFSS